MLFFQLYYFIFKMVGNVDDLIKSKNCRKLYECIYLKILDR